MNLEFFFWPNRRWGLYFGPGMTLELGTFSIYLRFNGKWRISVEHWDEPNQYDEAFDD